MITSGSSSDGPPLLENGKTPPGVVSRLKSIWEYRELLSNLVRRELKVKYKNSVLGFFWTLLNPLLYLAVFSIVFGFLLPSGVELYGLYLLSGLLTWNLFAIGTASATVAITGNGPLVQKVWFPREILPIASIGATFVNFCFQILVLLVGLAVFWRSPEWSMLWLVVPALLVVLLLTTGLGLLLSAVNVYFRDVQHFLELALLMWFWLTPIVYQYDFMANAVVDLVGSKGERVMLANPMIPVVSTLQRVLYNPSPAANPDDDLFLLLLSHDSTWFLINLALVGAAALGLFVIALRVFGRLEANFGEEI